MNERIKVLTQMTLDGKMYPGGENIEFDKSDILLSEAKMNVKRLNEYIMSQKILLCEYQTMVRPVALDNPRIVGDYMHYATVCQKLLDEFYLQPIDNLVTFEWQHATADYKKIIKIGLKGLIEKINQSKENHKGDEKKIEFLECLEIAATTLIQWAQKCSLYASSLAEKTENEEYKKNLTVLSETLKRIPEHPAESFYDAVLSVYILFCYDPDSLGILDRTLYPYYKADIEKGIITPESAKSMLQELFLMLQANTPKHSSNFTKGGESHFCIGGYNEEKEDCFNEFSMLILEALTELPTYIPQVSLRWTKELAHETFEKVFNIAVNDANKRIAFVNDEIKIKAMTDILHYPYEVACNYSTVGCNETALPGNFDASTTMSNILRSMENTIYKRSEDIINAAEFDEFFSIYKSELLKDLDSILRYEDAFMRARSKSTSYVTSLLFPECIEKAISFTDGACKYSGGGSSIIGLVNVIDSLAVIKQFIYDEKIIDMKTLISALENDWQGYENLLTLIKKKGDFFGNDGDISNYVAKLLIDTIYEETKNRTSFQGYHLLFGNLQGYNPHHKWFGQNMKATPDGRRCGEMLKFGIGQNGGYDREGLSALLNSIAKCDEHGIVSGGSSVTNVNLDEALVKNPNNIPKTVSLFETYFKNGGSHFQLNFVSAENLKRAKITPEEYKNLRVRVSGFSEFFTNLSEPIQDDVIKRTVKR